MKRHAPHYEAVVITEERELYHIQAQHPTGFIWKPGTLTIKEAIKA